MRGGTSRLTEAASSGGAPEGAGPASVCGWIEFRESGCGRRVPPVAQYGYLMALGEGLFPRTMAVTALDVICWEGSRR